MVIACSPQTDYQEKKIKVQEEGNSGQVRTIFYKSITLFYVRERQTKAAAQGWIKAKISTAGKGRAD